jgi:tetratricopeptide (TPR) repeat protein
LHDASPTTTVAPAPLTAWEHDAIGRTLLASGDLSAAAQELRAALQLEPAGAWPNFYYGLCAYRTGDYQAAVAAFSVCIGTMPNVADFFYNRALAFAGLGQSESAMQDYDRALRIDSTHAFAALNRGMLHYQQKHLDQADADLKLALQHGADPASVYYDLALVHLAANNPAVALNDVSQSLERNPAHQQARQLYTSLRQDKKSQTP